MLQEKVLAAVILPVKSGEEDQAAEPTSCRHVLTHGRGRGSWTLSGTLCAPSAPAAVRDASSTQGATARNDVNVKTVALA